MNGRATDWNKTPLARFHAQHASARARGIEWRLTFAEWSDIWQRSGKYTERGRRLNEYCMARRGDVGAYEVGNVYICAVSQNHIEGVRIRKLTSDAVIAIRADGRSQCAIARDFGICQKSVSSIKRRETWAHVL